MAQDGPKQERTQQIAKALKPQFDQARLKLARQFAQAQDGRLIEQTEMLVFEELNRLKTRTQEVGIQERIAEAEAAFSPQARKAKLRNKGAEATTRLTINGPVPLRLRRWQGAAGVSERPGAQVLGLAVGEPSVGFRRMACRLGLDASSSFAREAGLLGELGMGPVSREKLRQVVEAEGQQVREAQPRQTFPLPWGSQDKGQARGPRVPLCMGVDGVMTRQVTEQEKRKRRQKGAGKRAARARAGKQLKPLPHRKTGADGPWKEVKIVGAYAANHEHRHWRSTTLGHLMAAVLITQVARRVGLSLTGGVVAVVDGAEWIEARLRESLPQLLAVILDFYHLSEHVHTAAKEAFGEGSASAHAWADRLLHAIRHESFAAFDALLGQCLAEQAVASAAATALTKLRQYVSQRRAMVNYPYFEAQGWPIGSGPTESMAGVLTSRVRGRGRRWDADNIDAVMAIQALETCAEWEPYWHAQCPQPFPKIAA